MKTAKEYSDTDMCEANVDVDALLAEQSMKSAKARFTIAKKILSR